MTLQELDVIYSNAYEKAYYFGEPPHFKALPLDDYIALSEWASLQAMAAVVRALRDEFADAALRAAADFEQYGSVAPWETADAVINEILGDDAGEKVAGMSQTIEQAQTQVRQLTGITKSQRPDIQFEPATDPAPAVCEWRQAYSAYPNRKWRVRGCTQETTHLDNLFINDKRSCPSCGKPIKFVEAAR